MRICSWLFSQLNTAPPLIQSYLVAVSKLILQRQSSFFLLLIAAFMSFQFPALARAQLTALKLLPSGDLHNVQFGDSVAISGDYAIVGAYDTEADGFAGTGVAYIFKKEGDAWQQQAILKGETPLLPYSWFGFSVAIDGEYAVVGAKGQYPSGKVYVFHRQEGTWQQEAVLSPTDGGVNDYFGASVSIQGNYLIVGAIDHDSAGSDINNRNQGAVYIYRREGTVWSRQTKLMLEDGGNDDQFGRAVSIFGDFALIGARNTYPLFAYGTPGAAYIFKRMGDNWIQVAKLTAPDGAAYDHFGASTAMNDCYAVVGSPGHKLNGLESGAAYVFKRQDDNWRFMQKLIAGFGDSSNRLEFGRSLTIAGEYIAAGAPAGQGCFAYLFEKTGSIWIQKEKIISIDGTSFSSRFGRSVSLSGNSILIGSPGNGSAYIYQSVNYSKDLPSLSVTPAFLDVDSSEGNVSINIANIGTGEMQWSVGTSTEWLEVVNEPNGVNRGTTTIKRQQNSGPMRSGAITVSAPSAANSPQVVNIRQVDGLGRHIVKINVSPTDFGIPAAIHGSHAALGTADGVQIYDLDGGLWRKQATVAAGINTFSIAICNDYMIIGDPYDSTNAPPTGAVYIYKREAANWVQQCKLIARDGSDQFGRSVSISGDYAVVGAPYSGPYDGSQQGAAYIYKRTAEGITALLTSLVFLEPSQVITKCLLM